MKNWLIAVAFVALALVGWLDADAQCVMCKAVAESGNNNYQQGIGDTNPSGSLNTGIIYLMSVVYIVLMMLVFIFFREQLARKWAEMRSSRQRA